MLRSRGGNERRDGLAASSLPKPSGSSSSKATHGCGAYVLVVLTLIVLVLGVRAGLELGAWLTTTAAPAETESPVAEESAFMVFQDEEDGTFSMTSEDELRSKMFAYYQARGLKDKLGDIDKAIRSFRGDERAINDALIRKYGVGLSEERRPLTREEEVLRRDMVAFFNKHNPARVADVDRAIIKYKGDRSAINDVLRRKYGAALEATTPPPTLSSTTPATQAATAAVEKPSASTIKPTTEATIPKTTKTKTVDSLITGSPRLFCFGLPWSGCEDVAAAARESDASGRMMDPMGVNLRLRTATEGLKRSGMLKDKSFDLLQDQFFVHGSWSAFYAEELLRTYPDARVVVAALPVDDWWGRAQNKEWREKLCKREPAMSDQLDRIIIDNVFGSRSGLCELSEPLSPFVWKARYSRFVERLLVLTRNYGEARLVYEGGSGASKGWHTPKWMRLVPFFKTPRLKVMVLGLPWAGADAVFHALSLTQAYAADAMGELSETGRSDLCMKGSFRVAACEAERSLHALRASREDEGLSLAALSLAQLDVVGGRGVTSYWREILLANGGFDDHTAAASNLKIVVAIRPMEDWLKSVKCAFDQLAEGSDELRSGAAPYEAWRAYQNFVDDVARKLPAHRVLFLDSRLPDAWPVLCSFLSIDCSVALVSTSFPASHEVLRHACDAERD